ncbi:hypothetical protein N0V90_007372 [Kalmusia sp. IMI 367209]|nr:hypothetical protein N0V90_007372 [Kalmusia sp. IMI 367209]
MPQPQDSRTAKHASRSDRARRALPRRGNPLAPATTVTTLHTQPNPNEKQAPAHYFLEPTTPSPFAGTLDASLDAILEFGRVYPQTLVVMDVLRNDVDPKTNWTALLIAMLELKKEREPDGRHILEEILFLVTRTLLPEQIAQNRAIMCQMYRAKRDLSFKIVLRYDTLREWHKGDNGQYLTVESRKRPTMLVPYFPPENYDILHPGRRPLDPAVWATLVAGPAEGYATRKMAEAMKHHVTDLDKLLMFTDKEVMGWSTMELFQKLVTVATQWQWLRKNTETLEDMEVSNWEEVEGKVDECEWVMDQASKN